MTANPGLTDPTDQIAALREALTAVRACRLPPRKSESIHGPYESGESWNVSGLTKLLPRIDAALALPHPVGDRESIALTEATELAKAMWLRWYRKDAPDWQPLGTVRGVISQIDNMSAGMVRVPDPLALSPTAAAPEGFVLVPREPTEAMVNAYFERCRERGFRAHITATAAWSAMLAATPTPENKS